MSNTSGVTGSAGIYGVTGGSIDPSGMSPDGLLAYCEMQLNNYSGQISELMKQQRQSLADQGIVNQLKATLEQFGTKGPQDAAGMAKAYNAYQQAINALPDGDPVKAQLQQACAKMLSDYNYTPPGPLSPGDQAKLNADLQYVNSPDDHSAPEAGRAACLALAKNEITQLQAQSTTGTLGNAPGDGQWGGTTDDVSSIAGNINSQSQLSMLQLQQLSSYQQQATELTINMMNKEDATLLDEAKNA
jgi:hypothetical protein